MPDGTSNVCAHTVADDLCIGCGVCAGVCPSGNLTMSWNADGCYQPVDSGRCAGGCHACLDVCPFGDREENEDAIAAGLFARVEGISHTPQTGYYLCCYAGYTNGGYRERGASGGIASWLLATLLERGEVDRVVCVRPNPDPEKLFAYAVLSDADEVRGAAKSAYYPVEMSEAVGSMLREDARYAVVGLPCFLKALRLAAGRNARLRERVVAVVGLTCGQLKSKAFARGLALVISNDARPTSVVFRKKTAGDLSCCFSIGVAYPDGRTRSARLVNAMPDTWTADLFMPRACGFCDDVFAEVADVACMDAWLPEYERDWRGTSIVLVRSQQMQRLLQTGADQGELALRPIRVGQVIASQAEVIRRKREMLGYRLWLAKRAGQHVPRKRIALRRPSVMIRLYLNARENLRATSHAALRQAGSPSDYDALMRPARRRMAAVRLACVPGRVANRLRRRAAGNSRVARCE